MTYYNAVFDEKQYKAVNLKAAKYYLETAKSSVLPLISTDVFDAYEFLHPVLAEATGATAGIDYVDEGRKMNARSNYSVIDLFVHQGLIQIRNQDIAKFGADFIADKHDAEIEHLVEEIDNAAFHGPLNDQGLQIAHGIIGLLTPLINIISGTAADCSTKGEIWHVIKEMIEDIPFAMRESGPDMIMWINEKTFAEASAPDRIYQDKVEWDFIYDQFIGEKAVHGRKIGQVIITDKINCNVDDSYLALHSTADGYQTGDTLGTHGRILICVPDPRWAARIESAGFHLVGEERKMLHVNQLYGWHGRVYPLDGDAWNYSEQLTF